jgi:hypothetical protein
VISVRLSARGHGWPWWKAYAHRPWYWHRFCRSADGWYLAFWRLRVRVGKAA